MKYLKSISVSLTAFLLLCTLWSKGQGDLMGQYFELDKKYTPDPNSIFNNLLNKNTSTNKYPSSSEVVIKNSIKFCPTALIRGKALFFYERELYKGLALNIGIGKAFIDDYLQKSFFELQSTEDANGNMAPSNMLLNATYDGSGPLFYLGLKTYFSGQMFDGSYIEFAYRHERLDYLMNSASVSGFNLQGNPSFSFYMNDFSFGYGYSGTTGRKNNSTHEFFVNMGIKLFKYPLISKIPSSPNYQTTTGQLNAHLIPSINIGYCLGFGF